MSETYKVDQDLRLELLRWAWENGAQDSGDESDSDLEAIYAARVEWLEGLLGIVLEKHDPTYGEGWAWSIVTETDRIVAVSHVMGMPIEQAATEAAKARSLIIEDIAQSKYDWISGRAY